MNRLWVQHNRIAAPGIFFFMLMLATACPVPAAAPEGTMHPVPDVSPQKIRQLGQDIYRRGILPSGEPLMAFIRGDIPASGTAFTCANCHQRSGLGSVEGQVYTPPTNGKTLFEPAIPLYRRIKVSTMPPRRPAYTEDSLAEALRAGIDPAGRVLDEFMPRYLLNDEDMAMLIAYLKTLSSEQEPGVTDTTLRFATVIAEDVSPERREAMLAPLETYVTLKNTQAKVYGEKQEQLPMSRAKHTSRRVEYMKLALSRWVLKGTPDTWRSQLEEYYKREPVFGLLGGITNGAWKPIHDFSEAGSIPSLFPITDYPVISEADWYTLYLSKGYYQEGEAAARFISSRNAKGGEKVPIQIVQSSPEGEALAAGFLQTWLELGHEQPVTLKLKTGELLTETVLKKALDGRREPIVLLWADAAALPALESLAADRERPEMVFISADYCGKDLWALKEQTRGFTYITYPYGLSPDGKKTLAANAKNQTALHKIAQQTGALLQVLTLALKDMNGNYYRDNLLDVIGMIRDQPTPLYGRLSFGPGQRYASKGCYIVQLSAGANPEIIRKSDWVIH